MNNSLVRFGGICAIFAGIVGALADILYLLLPAQQQLLSPGRDLLPSFVASPTLLTLELWALAIVGLLGIAVVPAVSQLVHAGENGWGSWTSNLAFLGFAVTAVGSVLTVERLPRVAAAFVAADAAAKVAIAATWKSTLDPLGVFGYGAIGLWILVVSVLALRGDKVPRPLAYAGILYTLANWLIPLALFAKIPAIFFAVAVIGLILGLIWYVWTGVVLRRTA